MTRCFVAVPQDILANVAQELDARIAGFQHSYAIDMKNAVYGRSFTYYLLFTHWPAMLPSELDEQQVFYNRYYWFRRFAEAYQREEGGDFGIQQQGFQLLEYATCDPDWLVVEKVEEQAMKDSQLPSNRESL